MGWELAAVFGIAFVAIISVAAIWIRSELRSMIERQGNDMAMTAGAVQSDLQRMERAQQQMLTDSAKFIQTLRGDQHYQGQWGEMVLDQVLASAGLRESVEYLLQPTIQVETSEGPRTLRPDVIVNLPDERQLVIDSKVSLEAFWRYKNATEEVEREQAITEHIQSMQRHIEDLGERSYHRYLRTPGFTFLFTPVEGAAWLLIDRAPELLERSWKNGVLLVSPTSLVPTLRTVAGLWRSERQSKSIRDLAKEGGMLYDRFISLVDDVEKLERYLRQAQECRESIDRKLRGGRTSLAGRVEKLRELGAATQKNMPKTWVEGEA